MIKEFGFSEARLKAIEDQAIKAYKERETRQHVEELLSHLEFADIKDFNNVSAKEFEEVNFYEDERVSENVTESQSSQCNDNEDNDEAEQEDTSYLISSEIGYSPS